MEQEIKKEELNSLANAPTKKKITFFAAILMVLGNCIGSGIFFKSSTVMADSGLNFIIAIVAWLVAGFVVICMALALVEISSGRNDNLGIIGWCKAFNSKYVYKGCKYFMVFIYLPLTFFFMPLYVLMAFQDALSAFGANNNFGTNNDWVIWSLISLLLSLWFIFSSGLSSQMGNIQNKIITAFKFIPLVFAAIMGYVVIGMNGANIKIGEVVQHWDAKPFIPEGKDVSQSVTDIFTLSPLFGFFGALGAIFFAFDGFYATSGIQSEMKEPKKTPKAIVLGLAIVTGIYLLIAISMSVVSPEANLGSFTKFLDQHNVRWIGGVISLLVAIGVLGIVNGFSIWCPRYIQDLINEGELPVPVKWFKKCSNSSFPIVGIKYTLAISIPFVILLDVIGGLGYFPGNYVGAYDDVTTDAVTKALIHTQSTAKLYNFADLLATWCAVFAFAFIACSIYGGIRNRRTNHVKVVNNKYFIPTAWVSVIVVFIALIMTGLQPLINIGLYANAVHNGDKNITTDVLIGNILLVIVFLLFVGISFGPIWLEEKMTKARLKTLEVMHEFVNDQNKMIRLGNLVADNDKLMDYLVHEEKLSLPIAKAVSHLPILKSLVYTEKDGKHFEYEIDNNYVESLSAYIQATKMGIDSFKIHVKSHYTE